MKFLKRWAEQIKIILSSDAPPTPAQFQNSPKFLSHDCEPHAPTPQSATASEFVGNVPVSLSLHLRAKQWLRNCAVLDIETTGLNDDDEIIEIAIIDGHGKVLLDTRVLPQDHISAIAAETHRAGNEIVESAPRWSEIHDNVFSAIASRENLVIFNSEFKIRMIQQTASKHGLKCPPIHASCVMIHYAEYYGDWDEARQNWRFQSLANAATQQGIKVDGNLRKALSDCKITLGIIQAMAEHPAHRDQFDPELEAATQKECGCDFYFLVCAYMEYAKFSGWNSSKSVAIDKCETWVRGSIGPAGHALTWKETGIDPLVTWKNERLLLTHRIENMTLSEVAMALNAGEDINQGDAKGVTPLMMAALRTYDLAVLQLLLDQGADIDAKDISGQTALHRAVTRGFDTLACAQLLIRAGASASVADNANVTPLSLAISARCDDDVVALLHDSGGVCQTKEGAATPLHFSARYNPKHIPDLIKMGCDPNAYDDKKRTPIYWAMWGRPESMVFAIRFLFEGGADVEWINSSKESPLIYALKNSAVPAEVVDYILGLGANINTKNRYGTTPLHFAAKYSPGPEKILVLLKHGADTENTPDRAGKTPKDYLSERAKFPWPVKK